MTQRLTKSRYRTILSGLLCLALVVSLLPTTGACTMTPKPDMSLVQDGLKIPVTYNGVPNPARFELMRERGFYLEPGKNDAHYLTLMAYYRKAFEVYLLVTLRLDLYEQEIEDTKLGFGQFLEYARNWDVYAQENMLNLTHLYLHNNINIENLSLEDIAILEELYAKNGSEITDEALGFVSRTYKQVIQDIQEDGTLYPDDMRIMLSFPYQPNTFVMGNYLAIVFNNPDVYTEDGDFVDKNEAEREAYLFKRLPEIRLEMQAKLGMPVALLIADGTRGKLHYIVDDTIREMQ